MRADQGSIPPEGGRRDGARRWGVAADQQKCGETPVSVQQTGWNGICGINYRHVPYCLLMALARDISTGADGDICSEKLLNAQGFILFEAHFCTNIIPSIQSISHPYERSCDVKLLLFVKLIVEVLNLKLVVCPRSHLDSVHLQLLIVSAGQVDWSWIETSHADAII